MKYSRSWSHWIRRIEFTPSHCGSKRNRLISRHQHLWTANNRGFCFHDEGGKVCSRIFVARLCSLTVRIDHCLFFLPKGVRQNSLKCCKIEPQKKQNSAKRDRVLHNWVLIVFS